MALTIKQLRDLGFKPARKSSIFKKKFDTWIFTLNNTDYLYLGYDENRREVNNKIIWKSFVNVDGERISYIVTRLGDTGYNEMRQFIRRAVLNSIDKPEDGDTD